MTKASPIPLPDLTTTLSRPAGRPASSKIFAGRSPPVTEASLAGITTTVLPAASARATVRLVSGAMGNCPPSDREN